MSRISAERLFKSHYPEATIERQTSRYRQAYYLVRKTYGAYMWAGSGDTKAQAWADACRACKITALKPEGNGETGAGS